jgi:hypothetical protein
MTNFQNVWVTFALMVGLSFSEYSTATPILIKNNSGELTGAYGVEVDDSLYSVEFIDNSCINIFSGCSDVSNFNFQTRNSSLAASRALLEQVFVDQPSGTYDSTPSLTHGIENTFAGFVHTVYGLEESGGETNLKISAANNSNTELFDGAGGRLGWTSTDDYRNEDSHVFAKWTELGQIPDSPPDLEPVVQISNFDGGAPFEDWGAKIGNGTREIVESPIDGDDNKVMQLTIDNPNNSNAVFTGSIIAIPNEAFTIDFSYMFQTSTGSLDVLLNGTLLETIFAFDVWDPSLASLLSASILVDDESLLALDYASLTFGLYPGSPSQIVIDDILLNSAQVPEPSTLAIFALGMIGLASRRFKKQS